MKLLFYTLTFFCGLLAQNAALTTAADLHELSEPHLELEKSFIYQVREGERLSHYRVTMNAVLLQGNRAFRWPKEIPDSLKIKGMLSKSRNKLERITEVIFNDKIILIPLDSLYYFENATAKPYSLERVPIPGILLITGPVSVRRISAKGLSSARNAPLFYYTFPQQSPDFLLIQSPGKISRFYNPQVIPGQFKSEHIELFPWPALPPVTNLSAPDTNLSLEFQIAQTESLWSAQKRADSLWLDSLKNYLSRFPERADFETDSAYTMRQSIQSQELSSLMDSIRNRELPTRYISFMDRLQTLRLALNKTKTPLIQYRDPHEIWWKGKLQAGIQTLLGAHLPKRATDPGPARMADIQGSVSYSDIWNSVLIWRADLGLGYQQWQYNQDVLSKSRRFWTMLSANWIFPLLEQNLSIRSTKTLYSELGLIAQLSRVQIQNAQSTDRWTPFGAGARIALGFAWGPSGQQIGLAYAFTSDHFGSFGLFWRSPFYAFTGETP